jgi:hypothetical protein
MIPVFVIPGLRNAVSVWDPRFRVVNEFRILTASRLGETFRVVVKVPPPAGKRAVSPAAFGTFCGFQFAAVFQLPLVTTQSIV